MILEVLSLVLVSEHKTPLTLIGLDCEYRKNTTNFWRLLSIESEAYRRNAVQKIGAWLNNFGDGQFILLGVVML